MKLVSEKGRIVDSFYLWRTIDPRQFQLAQQEQRIVDQFLASRSPTAQNKITVADILWGTFVTAVAATVGYLALRWAAAKFG